MHRRRASSGTLAGFLLLAGLVLTSSSAAVPPKLIEVCPSGCDYSSVNSAANSPSTNAGDTILIEPGTYSEQVSVPKSLRIEGQASGARPVISWAGNGATTFTNSAAGTTIQHLEIDATGTNATALTAPAATVTDVGVNATASGSVGVALSGGFGGPGTLTDSTVSADTALDVESAIARRVVLNGASVGVTTRSGGLVTDSVVTATGSDGVAALAPYQLLSPSGPLTLRNVTAFASGSGSTGLEANYYYGSPGGAGGAIDALNVIARGAAVDVAADAFPGSFCPDTCSAGVVRVGSSNFRTTSGAVDQSPGHNQAADPLLVHPIVGPGQDFHETCGSPTIDAGTADANNGASDLDGKPRQLGPAPDIGAYEAAKQRPVVATGAATKVGTAVATLHGGVNPDGCATTYHFEFGRTGYGSRTTAVAIGAGTSTIAVSKRVTGLLPGKRYRYRLVAQSPAGTTVGPTRTFVTAPICVVPKIAGKKLRPAKRALRHAHCKLGHVTKRKVAGRPGRVLSQRPKPGRRLPAGSKVAVVVSKR